MHVFHSVFLGLQGSGHRGEKQGSLLNQAPLEWRRRWGPPSRQNGGGKIGDNFAPREITIFEMLE